MPTTTIDYSKKHKHGVFSIKFVPGSNTEVVTCGDDEKVCMWDLRSKKCVMEQDHCHGEKLYWAEAFSRDGKKTEVITCGWDKGMKLWQVGGNVVKGKQLIETKR